MRFTVEVVEHETGAIVRGYEVISRHHAEKVERGVNINLNHERFFTRITEDGGPSGAHAPTKERMRKYADSEE